MHLLSAEGRIALAREAMSRGTGKVAVIDDAVIAACAQAGKRSYDVTMRAVLPYVSPNPYNPDLMTETPEEMFYGRRLERDKLASFTGSAFISGGRRLGKTALLYAVRQQLERTGALALLVVIQHVAAATRDPAELWPVLGARLAEAGVIPSAPPYSLDSVTAGIRQWLAEDDDRRLMVLLDECDFFLRADAEKNFANVVALRNLMMEPGSRFKVVFSGLQHVTRYLHLPNQPLSHLPQPIVIGPLDPSAASQPYAARCGPSASTSPKPRSTASSPSVPATRRSSSSPAWNWSNASRPNSASPRGSRPGRWTKPSSMASSTRGNSLAG